MKRPQQFGTRGFTLLEIMLVVMIIALLAGSAIYFMGGNIGIAQDTRTDSDVNAIETQLMMYQTLNGSLPTTEQGLKALVNKPETEPRPRNWRQQMQKVPEDAWHHEYQYVQPSTRNNPKGYDLFSAGKDLVPGTADDRGNWENK